MNLKKLLSNLDLIYGIPHELAHYLTGRFLNVAVILDLKQRRVLVPKDIPVWKHLAILVVPIILGLTIVLGFLSVPLAYSWRRSTAQIALWGSAYGVIILISCETADWRDFIRYCRTGEIT